METINGVPSPTNEPSLLVRALEDRYDRIIEVIAGSESDKQIAPELFLELADIIRQLESE